MNLAVYTLLGTAVGDAFGLKVEGLPRRAVRDVDWSRGPFFGRAVLSDDTEQSFLVGQALLRCGGDAERFRRLLRWRLVGWLFAGPPGGGLGTARSIAKLALGFSNGVRTAGNGAAMRAPVIGAAFWNEPDRVAEFVRASTTLTHNDERAFVGALAVALAAGAGRRGESVGDVLNAVGPAAEAAPQPELWAEMMHILADHLERAESVGTFAEAIGCGDGVSGFTYHTVPVALYAWARYDDPAQGLQAVWDCGGDTDSVGAIAGALLYAKAAREPDDAWLSRIADRPLTVRHLRACGEELGTGGRPIGWAWWLMPARNLLVFPLILFYAVVFMIPKKYIH